MNEPDQNFRVAVRAEDSGGYVYQIFTVAGEPRTFRSDSRRYATPEEAERAGYEAVDALRQ
jgi:predicted ATPase